MGRAVVALGCLVGAVSPAAAHKASLFVMVQGGAIVGEAYFRGGSPIRDALVTVLDPAGQKLGQIRTDQDGKFVFHPQSRCDHRLVVDAGDGHAAEATVRAEELPNHLSPPAPASGSPPPAETAGSVKPSTAEPKLKIAPLPDAPDSLRTELESIQSQLVQLRRELAAMEQKTRWHDVLGGIGYILGLTGLAYYFLGVRRNPRERPAGPGPQRNPS